MLENILLFLPLIIGSGFILFVAYYLGTTLKPNLNFVFRTLYGFIAVIIILLIVYCLVFTLKFIFALRGYYGY